VKGREGILRVHTRKVPTAENVDVILLARQTPGFAGADLENLVNEAALLAARKNKDRVEMADFEVAKDKVLMGPERRSMIITAEERRTTAYHEAGHALVANLLPGADPLHKVTIIPRGMALGLTQQVPVDDRHNVTKQWILGRLAISFGGRAAEELVLGQVTTGASDDIERATDLARKLVCEWGMSEKLGPMTFGKKEEEIFLGRDFTKRVDYSETTAVQIDGEVRRVVLDAYERAKMIIRRNLEALHKIAEGLLEREVLDGGEINEIIRLFGGSSAGGLRDAAAAAG
jgi:cell division protease FtsH